MILIPVNAPAGFGQRLSNAVERALNRIVEERAVVPLAIVATLLVGAGDYATGVETTFTLLYLFPLAFGAWLRGRGFGFLLAVIATSCATLTEFVSAPRPLRMGALIWNQFASLSLMLLVVWVLVVLRAYVERERSSRELAVEQLRHAERLNMIGKLAAGVAHELGTPLNVISGSAEMLLAGEVNEANISKYSSSILEQTKKMTAIIRHLLDFGRRGGSSRVSVDLNELVTHAVDLLLPMAKRRSCRIVVEPLSRAVPVLVNPSEVEQVFSNLLINALQAMTAGGTAHVRISVETRGTAAAVFRPFACVVVQDDGAGIDERDLAHVFDPFFTTKGVGEGTGLGLSVSYGIVQDHAGSIEVSSRKGEGACFTVLLPLATSRHLQAISAAATSSAW
ncbi:MAG TPA: ATP-binding protein [Polyangiaceae bacterium]|nr:ATP-binding protein [Polyangiaceae bacterium]